MRIAVVSAHYPPNFTSGGSLAPQRLARGMADRGHDVYVYAGHLDPTRSAGEAWAEADAGQVSVHWIEIHPWIGWSDPNNFDNPVVTADYRAWLSEVTPDVVHVHSCQAIGVGVVEAAADADIPVVITMHDFWWTCARQFLADRTYTPCSLVVDAGVCACEVDRRWLGLRNQRLREALSRVAAVLCPSASAAAVMAANGVDPAKLRVDENGLDPFVAAPPPRSRHPGVTFRYTGGSNEMKGVRVALDATRELEVTNPSGWRLVAHDIEDFLVASNTSIHDVAVEAVPAFAPGDAASVWAATDVLLVPSIMRESHSLVTREALAAGVPVVCTDTLGPEEVVRNGENGLVVPAADATALAAAMRRLVDEPDFRARVASAAHAVQVRSIADQVDGLLDLYAFLRVSDPVSGSETRKNAISRVLFVVGIDGAPLRYRARLPAEALGLLGVHTDVAHYRDASVPSLAATADALVVYRVPATREVLALIAEARGRGVPVIYDVDDLIFDPDLVAAEIPALAILPPVEAALWLDGVRRYRTTLEACDAFVGSTTRLCEHAASVTGLAAHRFANGVGLLIGQQSDAALRKPRAEGPLRIGYLSGTDTHDHDWAMVEPAVAVAMDRHADVELWLVGLVQPSDALARFGDRVKRIGFTAWTGLPTVLRDLDINLAPLTPDSRFNDAKSAIKWLEAGLVETPTVASPTEPYREAIVAGLNGLLASTPEEWVAALEQLITSPADRHRLGARARRDALLRWSPHLQGRRYLEILQCVSTAARRSEWADVAVPVEPYGERPLEPYALPHRWSVILPPRARMQYRRFRAFLWRSYRTLRRYGPLGVARRIPDRVRRGRGVH